MNRITRRVATASAVGLAAVAPANDVGAADRARALLRAVEMHGVAEPDPAHVARATGLRVAVAPPLAGEVVYLASGALCVASPTPWNVACAIALWAHPAADQAFRNDFAAALLGPMTRRAMLREVPQARYACAGGE